MKTKISIFSILIAFSIIISSCKNDKTVNPVETKKVYMLLGNNIASSEKNYVSYYVDSVLTKVTDGITIESYEVDMAVENKDVYVLIYKRVISTGNDKYALYKNGVQIDSFPVSNDFFATCMDVSGTDIYIAGYQSNPSSGYEKIRLRKNGVMSDITGGIDSNSVARCYEIKIIGSDVYISGYETIYNTPPYIRIGKYWKNGVAYSMANHPSNPSSEVHRLIKVGSDIYTSGIVNGKVGYWKNGNLIILSDAAGATFGLAASGNDIYVAGIEMDASGSYQAVYWKNNVKKYLTTNSQNAQVYGMAINGNDVYIVGVNRSISSNGVYWKNEVEYPLNISNGYSYGYRVIIE